MQNNAKAACPVCAGESSVVKSLTADYLRDATTKFTGIELSSQVAWRDYDMCECASCSLQFALPVEPAGDDYYEWLNQGGDYYTEERWEWNIVEEMVTKAAKNGPVSVLEFGAGAGFLLQRLKRAGATRVVAIERSDMAAERLQAQGIESVTADAAEATLEGCEFDFVCSFHCLEHVGAPLSFMRQKRQFAGPKGRVLVSVPYSPMYFETRMFDPLNHPPHHMTRWNAKSLTALATVMGEQVQLHSPTPYGLFTRAKHAVACETLGPNIYGYRRRRRWLAQMRPMALLIEAYRQMRRDRVAGKIAGDVVLAELTSSNQH